MRLGIEGSAPPNITFPRGFEVIVDDLEGARPVPAPDRLRVLAVGVTRAQIGVDHGAGGAVEPHTATHIARGIAVNVGAVEDQVVRYLGHRILRTRAVA